ncbi:MAG: CBS domain-containing protein, partial [Gammaproteobacteria bacterium]
MYSDFDTDDPPFSLLTEAERRKAIGAMDINFYAAGDVLIEGGAESRFVFVVDKGLVEERDPATGEQGRAVAHYRDNEVFGSLAVLRGRARHRYVAMEDTLCHQLSGDVFRELVYSNPQFGQFFLQDLATKTKLVAQSGAYRDLVSFNLARVDESCMRLAVLVESEDSIRSVVETLKASRSDCALARRGSDYGILTRTNLLEAVALSDHSLGDPVGAIATWNLITINEGEFLFDALIKMTRHGIERLVVMADATPVGLVEMSDILGFLSSHSHVIALRVDAAKVFSALTSASTGIFELARSLFAQRVSVRFIMDLLAELHRRIVARNYQLLASEETLAGTCLLVLGSEGR